MWVSAGRSQIHSMYNLKSSVKENDIWYSLNGQEWAIASNLTGDFFIQNVDVAYPGKYAPWYQRFGHSMDSITYRDTELMIIMGGFAPNPINDMWITEDGFEWGYASFKQGSPGQDEREWKWSPRAWHRTTTYDGKLIMLGGTPLNNEVYRLNDVQKFERKGAPRPTRVMFLPYYFEAEWELLSPNGAADWSPRVGFGIFSQWYRTTNDYEDAAERLVLVGGYGGWTRPNAYGDAISEVEASGMARPFMGYSTLSDVWESTDGGVTWRGLANMTEIRDRAWFGFTVTHHHQNPKVDMSLAANLDVPRMYIFGGGRIGYRGGGTYTDAEWGEKFIDRMAGKSDGYWSRDGINWYKINYEEGGGTSVVSFYSSQLWAKEIVDGSINYVGLWGHSLQWFNPQPRNTPRLGIPGIYIIAGDTTGLGATRQEVFRAVEGVFCDKLSGICGPSGQEVGQCPPPQEASTPIMYRGYEFFYVGCECPAEAVDGTFYSGEYCDDLTQEAVEEKGDDASASDFILILGIIGGSLLALATIYGVLTRD